MASEPSYYENLEPLEFWDLHKSKIIAYGSLALLAAIAYSVYAIQSQNRENAARALYAEATTPADYQAVIEKASGSVVAGDASLQLADSLRSEKKYDEAIATLREFIDREPKHPLISGAWLSLATTFELQGKTDEAIASYQKTASQFPTAYSAPLAKMGEARLLAASGKKEEARMVYENIMAQHPESPVVREAQRELIFLKQ